MRTILLVMWPLRSHVSCHVILLKYRLTVLIFYCLNPCQH
uniref:Uncharacterized protein n=1 Tax=Arundo donax TaxID=35708 RepID=A0A0A9AII1_ARUDO